MASLRHLEEEISKINRRNKRVESDKAWELSYARRVLLMLFTYLAIGFLLEVIQVSKPWLNALVPALAFFLSTLTFPLFKKIWLNYVYRK